MKEKYEGSSEEESDDEVPVRRTGFRMVTQSVGGSTVQQQRGCFILLYYLFSSFTVHI
jgi:hypothetical protein